MKIVYNNKDDLYCISLEYPETELYIFANDITEVRTRFIDMMTSLFDYTIRNSLMESKQYMKNKECEHEWNFVGANYSDFDTIHYYECIKCGAEKSVSLGI